MVRILLQVKPADRNHYSSYSLEALLAKRRNSVEELTMIAVCPLLLDLHDPRFPATPSR